MGKAQNYVFAEAENRCPRFVDAHCGHLSSLLSLHFVFVLQIEQDFRLLFDELTANKFLEKWPTSLKAKVITECHGLVPSTELLDLMRNAESTVVVENGKTKTVCNSVSSLYM